MILDADSGEIRDVNPYLMDLLGFSHADLLGKKLWDIGPLSDVLLSKISFRELQVKSMSDTIIYPLRPMMGNALMWNCRAMFTLLTTRG